MRTGNSTRMGVLLIIAGVSACSRTAPVSPSHPPGEAQAAQTPAIDSIRKQDESVLAPAPFQAEDDLDYADEDDLASR